MTQGPDSSIFRKVQPRRLHDEVAAQIQQAIIDERLKPGQKLPSQRDLMGLFQVSKISIIKAIGVLEQAGLVTTRYGARGGTFVSELDTGGFTESLRLLINTKRVSRGELAECRLTVEGRAAYLAAERRNSRDLTKMDELINALKPFLGKKVQTKEFYEITNSIHMAVVEACHNRLFQLLVKTINDCFMKDIMLFTPQDSMDKDCKDLKAIVGAIKAKNGDRAEQLMKDHITYFSNLDTAIGRTKNLLGFRTPIENTILQRQKR